VDRFTTFKLALALVAAILFAASLRSGLEWPRYVAIALLVVAVAMRFIQPPRRQR
jgi:hypothetical protein